MGKSLACPRCSVLLLESRGARIAAHACPECGGVWLATSLAERLKESLEAGREIGLCGLARAAAESAAATARSTAATDGQGIPCADCRAAMGHIVLPHAGIVVDTCPAHGTWFDRGELQHLVDCIKDPALRERSALLAPPGTPAPPRSTIGGSGAGVAAAVVGGAAVGLGASALAGGASDELQRQALQGDGGSTLGAVLEGAADAATDLVDLGDVASSVGETAAEAGFSLIEVIVGLFDF